MGAFVYGGRVVLSGAAQSLLELLTPIGNPQLNVISGFATISMRADPANAGPVYWSDNSGVTTGNDARCGYLNADGTAGEAYNIAVRGHVGLTGIFLVGTPGDAVFLFATEM